MPATPRPGKKSIYFELPNDLDRLLRRHCKVYGRKLADEIRQAIRRHLAYPPPVEDPAPFPADGEK